MPIGIKVTVNTAKAIGQLKAITSRQLPYAVATALTRTAKAAGDALARGAESTMTIRQKWAARHKTASLGGGAPKSAGFVSIPARKSDGLNGMAARVGHSGWQMAQQMDDDATNRKPLRSAYRFIPLSVGRTNGGKVRKADKPAALMGKPGVFVRDTSSGPIMFRRGKGGRVTPLYKLVKAQRIAPRMNFNATVRAVAKANLQRELERALAQAFRTAR